MQTILMSFMSTKSNQLSYISWMRFIWECLKLASSTVKISWDWSFALLRMSVLLKMIVIRIAMSLQVDRLVWKVIMLLCLFNTSHKSFRSLWFYFPRAVDLFVMHSNLDRTNMCVCMLTTSMERRLRRNRK